MDPKQVQQAIDVAVQWKPKPQVKVKAHPAASLLAMPAIPKGPVK